MTDYSNLRRDPFTAAFSWRTMDTEIKIIAEFDELPGRYGVQLQDIPKSGSITIVEEVTGGNTFSEVTTSPLQGQFRVDYTGGYIYFNILDNGTTVAINYEGGGTNMSVESLTAIVNNNARFEAIEEDIEGINDDISGTGGINDQITSVDNKADTIDYQINNTGGLLSRIEYLESIISSSISPGFSGLELSNDTDTDHDISVAAGRCSDTTFGYTLINPSSLVKQIDAPFAAGTGAGGMFTGSVSNNTWYAVHLIRKDSDGSIDVGFDTSATAANIPAGYTYYRRIGWVLTDGSANIIQFFQNGNKFFLTTLQQSVAAINPGTSAVLASVICPASASAIVQCAITNGDTTARMYALFTSPNESDSVPSSSLFHLSAVEEYAAGARLDIQSIVREIVTDSSSRIRYRISTSDATAVVHVHSLGWVDYGI